MGSAQTCGICSFARSLSISLLLFPSCLPRREGCHDRARSALLGDIARLWVFSASEAHFVESLCLPSYSSGLPTHSMALGPTIRLGGSLAAGMCPHRSVSNLSGQASDRPHNSSPSCVGRGARVRALARRLREQRRPQAWNSAKQDRAAAWAQRALLTIALRTLSLTLPLCRAPIAHRLLVFPTACVCGLRGVVMMVQVCSRSVGRCFDCMAEGAPSLALKRASDIARHCAPKAPEHGQVSGVPGR